MSQYVLITGTSSGIGFETAKLFAENGICVFAGVRKKADKVKLEEYSPNIKGILMDVTDSDAIEKAVKKIKRVTKELSAVICCAGMAVAGPMETLDVENIKEQFNINTFGALDVVRQFLPLVKKGKIIYISSMAASGIFPYLSPYCASKKATDIMLNSLMNEFKNKDVKIVSVKPGCIVTPFWDKSIQLNMKNFKTEKYQAERAFLKQNAEHNSVHGTKPTSVARLLFKIFNKKHPRLSYTIGLDSKITMFLSWILPVRVINFMIKCFMCFSTRKHR